MIIIKFLSWDVEIKVTTGLLSNKGIQTLNQVPHSLLVSQSDARSECHSLFNPLYYKYKVIKTHKPIRKGEKTEKGFYCINTT